MRIPLTKFGWPQVVAFPAVLFVIMAVCLLVGVVFLPIWAIVSIEIVLAAILIWSLMFFRDPYRFSPLDTRVLLSPADGKITDIEAVDESDFISGPAFRIGIFLSIFNAHINRAPCNSKIEKITYRPGKYKNAANPLSGQVNESNDLALVRTDSPEDRLIVRQISGAIARRIVCKANQGQELASGEKFGMIKFGSRTELYVPVHSSSFIVHSTTKDQQRTMNNEQRTTCMDMKYQIKCLVKIGDKVKAGLTPLVKYEPRPSTDGLDEIRNTSPAHRQMGWTRHEGTPLRGNQLCPG